MIDDIHLFGASPSRIFVDELFWMRDCTVTGKVDWYFQDEKLLTELLSAAMTSTSEHPLDWTPKPFDIADALQPPSTDTAIARIWNMAERQGFEPWTRNGVTL